MGTAGLCGYAHALADLLPPRERSREYSGMWRDGVDRWYGQQVEEQQLRRIMWYYERTAVWYKPIWCVALVCFYYRGDLLQYPHFGWDFGILQDARSMQRLRIRQVCPFTWARRSDGSRVWCLLELLQLRREVLQGIRDASEIPCGPSFMSGWQGIEQSSESVTERMGTSSSTEELGLRPEDLLEAGLAGDAPSDVGDVSEYELVD